jgi:hypothetical protein
VTSTVTSTVTPFGPFDLLGALDVFGPGARAAIPSDRSDVDDALPPRAVVRHATGTAATTLLEEGAVRAGLPHDVDAGVWRMIRRGHANGAAFLAFAAPVAAPAVVVGKGADGREGWPLAEGLALSIDIARAALALTNETALAGTLATADVLVQDDGRALVIAAPAPAATPVATSGREPLWALAPENRRSMYMGRPRPHVYFVGLCAYVLLTGRRPFGDDDADVHAHRLVALRDLVADAPPLVDAVIMRALAESPDERHETLDELLVELVRASDELPAPTAQERANAAHAKCAPAFERFTRAFAAG